MAFLNENEWILLNEIAYNISFIYTVEEMQQEMLNRWLPFLIPYDAAIFARISITEDGAYQFQTPAAFQLSQQAVNVWVQESLNSDAFRWVLYTCKGWGFSGIYVQLGRASEKQRDLSEFLFAQSACSLRGSFDLFSGRTGWPAAAVSSGRQAPVQ